MSMVFIVGAARSGTTSMLRALEMSKHTYCAMEPYPNLNSESRALMEGWLPNPYRPVAEHLIPRITHGLNQGKIYVEKQISLVPFMEHLDRLLNCKFIITVRDGRDAVTSLVNWHNQMFPIFYQECKESAPLSDRAKDVLSKQIGPDLFNYSLPRPGKEDPLHEGWSALSRFEMLAWYWSKINELLLEQMSKIDPSKYIVIDYTAPTVSDIKRVFEFVGLDDFNESDAKALLERKINSLQDRADDSPRFPKWDGWSDYQKQRFTDISFGMMHSLGYFPQKRRPRPRSFSELQPSVEERKNGRRSLGQWLDCVEPNTGKIESVTDVKLGHFESSDSNPGNRKYTTINIQALSPAPEHDRQNDNCDSCLADIIPLTPENKADIVFSDGAIDHIYDIDAFIKTLAHLSRKLLYITSRRGYFPALNDHRYRWDSETGGHNNDVSPQKIAAILKEEGFETVVIFPQQSDRKDTNAETVVIASRSRIPVSDLTCEHNYHYEYKPYKAEPSDLSAEDVVTNVNISCYYYSDEGLGLANDLDYFRRILSSLKSKKNIKPGTVHDLVSGRNNANLAIRIDIDMDPVTALEMSHISAGQKFPMSFYILHTAAYYGSFANGVFLRNEQNALRYLKLQKNGAEVGLHADPFSVYLEHGMDGAQAVKTELEWMKSIGLKIRGTASHNAAPVYGAENFEIFQGQSIRGCKYIMKDYHLLPLEVLDQKELGLEYDAGCASPSDGNIDQKKIDAYLKELPEGDFLRNPDWFRIHILDNPYCKWGFSYNIWLLGRDFWAIAGTTREGEEVFRFNTTWTDVEAFLDQLQPDEKALICLHPIYLGYRPKSGAYPNGLA